MKSTKNCSGTKTTKSTKNSSGSKSKNSASGTKKSAKNSSQESDSDPLGSYTGNPLGWGKYSDPIQDADDL